MTSVPGSQELVAAGLSSAPYILRPLTSGVPLSADGDQAAVRITCAEVLNENLYIGTSAGEVLHFVQIPPDPADPFGRPEYIIASRQQPPTSNETANGGGIQQILLLPTVHKACILNNGTLNFYTLPELSPAFPGLKPFSCIWVDGVDQNFIDGDDTGEDGVVVMLCLKNRIRLVRVTEGQQNPARVRDIQLGGCLVASRRGDFACVADASEYSLLDVVNQQRIPLFPISTLQDSPPEPPSQATLSPPSEQWPTRIASRSVSNASPPRPGSSASHGRSSSLNILGGPASPPSGGGLPHRPLSGIGRHGFDVPQSLSRQPSPRPGGSPERSLQVPKNGLERRLSVDKALPPPPLAQEQPQVSPPRSVRQPHPLHPHIVTPTPQEYLLATGTSLTEPGVGMFVNLDGDVVRGTIEFSSYPVSLAVDGKGVDLAVSAASLDDPVPEEGNILAIVRKEVGSQWYAAIEVQRWDVDPSEGAGLKSIINLRALKEEEASESDGEVMLSMRTMQNAVPLTIKEVGERLALRRLSLRSASPSDADATAKRELEELRFSNTLGRVTTRILIYDGSDIQWVVRNPYVLQLDARLDEAIVNFPSGSNDVDWFDPQLAGTVINDLRGLEPRNELDFLGFAYLRQKAAFVFFANLIVASRHDNVNEHIMRTTNEALLACDLDPRIIVSFLPLVSENIVLSEQGIWICGGLHALVEAALQKLGPNSSDSNIADADGIKTLLQEQEDVLHLVKSYLMHWRGKKGFGSVADAEEIFATVDIALLRILLVLDTASPRGPATAGSIRAELNSVVDSGVDSFDRAVDLLESNQRLYVLSRLHQSRKNSAKVLETWRRIIEGQPDAGGELIEGESEVRKYLSKLSNRKLVEEYGVWLAVRNPKLGAQVFADDHARVVFKPAEALQLLREEAPDAVKEYLEFLVFGRKQARYANELISYYLTVVLDELRGSNESRQMLLQSYLTYRALTPPKPTYRDFIADNAVPAEWWRSRLRLLQLLGGGIQAASLHSSDDELTASGYEAKAILERLRPFENELVPEMIILYGQQQRHKEAIRLLVQGLGDFDTAIRYCLFSGSSLFSMQANTAPSPSHDEQARLFAHLLQEFLVLESPSERIERTGELLERFGAWFEIESVLGMIPDGWSVEIVSSFIVRQLRRMVHERAETTVVRALSGAVNLKTSAEVLDRTQELGSVVQAVE